MKILLTIVASCCVLNFTAGAQSPAPLHLAHTYIIGGTGGWDYLAVSPVKNRLYVSHGTRVNILDKTNGDSLGVLENTTGVHGIAFDVANGKGFTSNGKLNTVTVFELQTNNILGQIATGQNPDAIFLEPFSKKIITCNGRGNNITIIDPKENKVLDSIALTGKPETAVSDGNGKMYVNIEDKNEITVIDVKSWKVTAHWSIAPGEGPTGLAIDKAKGLLFAGCDGQLIVISINTGKVIDKIPIGDGCDGVAFDPDTKNIFTSNGEGTISVIHENADNSFSPATNIVTKKGARTLTLDESTHKIYLPTAEFEPLPAGQKGRPSIKPGTFQVLVLEN